MAALEASVWPAGRNGRRSKRHLVKAKAKRKPPRHRPGRSERRRKRRRRASDGEDRPDLRVVARRSSSTGRSLTAAFQRLPRAVHARQCRSRAIRCGGPGAPVVLTNRHVVEGFTSLRLVTQSGDELAVTDVLQLRFADIAIISVEGALPVPLRLATAGAAPGQDVTVFGYPGGGDLDRQTGTVIDFVRDIDFGLTEILRVDVWVRPGNSGGPMLDPTGAVVGVVYAIELATDLALAVPADAVARLTGDTTASRAVVPCGR